MSSEVVIRARGLGKAYAIFQRPRDRLKQMLVRGRRKYYREFWALHDVSFEVRKGETVGIVGGNGSGKSTLLQLVCGILTPTCGRVEVKGRIAAMLELGAGFNPEFTGRENVLINAAILGLRPEQIEARFDTIAAFADIGEFLEQPVRTYSRGMYARLAFATSINVDPDILVVDEVLSVGDDAFKRKCFARINEIREGGATVLFVSHSANAVMQICNRAILFDRGKRLTEGDPKTVIAKYQKLAFAHSGCRDEVRRQIISDDGGFASPGLSNPVSVSGPMAPQPTDDGETLPARGSTGHLSPDGVEGHSRAGFDASLLPKSREEDVPRGARISDVRIEGLDGRKVNVLQSGGEYVYRYRVTFERPARKVRFGMMIKTINGVDLSGQTSHAFDEGLDVTRAGSVLEVGFRFRSLLAPKSYFTNAGVRGLVDGQDMSLHRIVDATMFRVEEQPGRRFAGMINLSGDPHFSVAQIE